MLFIFVVISTWTFQIDSVNAIVSEMKYRSNKLYYKANFIVFEVHIYNFCHHLTLAMVLYINFSF